nr:hypothetical protein [Tanacetum cinerariifolium]
ELSCNQNYDGNYYSHDLPSFPCCDNYGGSHETFQCQPITFQIDFSGSDQIQTPQYPEIHLPSQETSNEVFQANHSIQNEEYFENPSDEIAVSSSNPEEPPQDSDILVHKRSVSFNTPQISLIHAVARILSTKEPKHLLSMGYEHFSITPKTESNEVTESNAENLLPIPSKYEVTSEDEIECDMPANDDCSPIFTTFSNPLFNNDDLDFSDDESLPDEDVPAVDFKVYSNPLFNEDEINSDKLDPYYFNVESDFVKSLLNRDTFIDYSSKFDFSGELAHVNPEILKSNFDFEGEIRLIENFLYDNSFPRPPEELNAEIADTIIDDENDDDLSNDSPLEEVDLFLASDNSIPPGIENIADDPEGDIRFLEELLIDDSIHSYKSFDSNFKDNPSIPRPPPEPLDVETDTGEEIPVVMNDKDENVDYSSFIFFMFDKVFSLLSVE